MSSEPAYGYTPNHTVDPATGFIESNGFLQGFDARKKLTFLAVYKQNGLKLYRTCAEVDVKADTIHKHLNLDPAFKRAFDQTKIEYYDELEGTSRENALRQNSVIERIFQLKAAFPEKYGDGKRDPATNIQINFDGKTLSVINNREVPKNVTAQTSAEIDAPNLATESGVLSANESQDVMLGDGDI